MTEINGVKLKRVMLFCVVLLVACGRDPGPLEGTWRMEGLIPMTVTFRHGEEEALGIIERVSYRVEGNDVLVTYEDGMAKGTTMRYTILGPNVIRTELGILRRVGSTGPSQAEINRRKKQEIEQNTVCAYNADSGKCSCFHKVNGMKVSKSRSDCMELAGAR